MTDDTNENIDPLTYGTLTNNDIPSHYEEPSKKYESYIDIFDHGIMLKRPECDDTTFTIHPEEVPYYGTLMIDFFEDQPQLYLFDPASEREDPAYVFALPTEENPTLDLKSRH